MAPDPDDGAADPTSGWHSTSDGAPTSGRDSASGRAPVRAGDVVLVTGAAGGIGAAIAERVLADGWTAVLVDLTVPDPPAVSHPYGRGEGSPPDDTDARRQGTGHWVRGDVRSATDAATAVAAAGRLGSLRGLVNAAGVRVYRRFDRLDEALLREHLDVNLLGPALWMRAAAEAMIATGGGGSIVNLTSVMAHAAVPQNAAYCGSKAGLLGLSRAAALDLAPHGIRVNCLAPGPTDTPMLRSGTAVPAGVLDRIPLGRVGTPADIAGVVSFLLSADSAFMTGGSVQVDGGFLA